MLIDHFGQIFFPNIIWFAIIGRLAFPLFSWSIVKGFKLTKNFNKYAFRLLILAILSQIPYNLLFENGHLNVVFTLLAGLYFIKIYELKFKNLIKLILLLLLLGVAYILNFEYGVFGIIYIVSFYIFQEKYNLFFTQLTLIILGIYFYRFASIELFALISLPIVSFWDRYDFKIIRFIKYGFYPAHLTLLLIFQNIQIL